MTIDPTITSGQLLAAAITVVLALLAGAWALLSLSAKLYTARMTTQFSALSSSVADHRGATEAGIAALRAQLTSDKTATDRALGLISDQTRTLEHDLLTLKGDLPNHYERRDDAIRREMTIISRLERIGEKIREGRNHE